MKWTRSALVFTQLVGLCVLALAQQEGPPKKKKVLAIVNADIPAGTGSRDSLDKVLHTGLPEGDP